MNTRAVGDDLTSSTYPASTPPHLSSACAGDDAWLVTTRVAMSDRPRRFTSRGRRLWLRAALLLLLMAGLLGSVAQPPTVSAHATLVRSEPAVGGSYADDPRQITIWFSEAIEVSYSRIDVLRPDGSRATTVEAEALEGSTEPALTLDMGESLGDGAYTVVWSVLSAVDGHVSNGVFSFTVGDAALPGTDTEAALAASITADGPIPLLAEGVVRWASLLGGTLLVGALLFLPTVLLPVTTAAGLVVPARRWRWLLGVALLVTVLGHLGAALVQIMDATRSTSLSVLGQPLLTLLSDTRYGAVWLTRAVVLLAMALLLWALLRRRTLPVGQRGRSGERGHLWGWRSLWPHMLHVGAVLLLTTSLGSHAAAREGALRWPVINDWLHLAGAAVWAGGLPALLLALRGGVALPVAASTATGAGVGTGAVSGLQVRSQIVRRFTVWALAALLVLIASGVLAARQFVVSFEGVTSTDYGRWFVVKLVLIVAAAGFGAWHLLVVRPALVAGSATSASPAARAAAERDAGSMRWTLPLETLLAVLAIGAAGVLTASIPASVELEAATTAYGETRLVSEASVTLRATPGQVGTNEFSVFVDPVDDTTYGTIQRIYLDFVQPERAPTPQRVQLQATDDPFTFRGTGAYLALDGDWEVRTIIRRAGVLDSEVLFPITADSDGLRPLGTASPSDENAAVRAGFLLGLLLLAALAAVAWSLFRLRRLARSQAP